MSKLLVAAAALCTAVFLSVPAFSESLGACQQGQFLRDKLRGQMRPLRHR